MRSRGRRRNRDATRIDDGDGLAGPMAGRLRPAPSGCGCVHPASAHHGAKRRRQQHNALRRYRCQVGGDSIFATEALAGVEHRQPMNAR